VLETLGGTGPQGGSGKAEEQLEGGRESPRARSKRSIAREEGRGMEKERERERERE
jgi:hypothetical protein